MKFKAISLKQPWANLVASGKKTIETRKWSTKYRGDLVICSSQNPKIKPYGKALCIRPVAQ
ncbi:MAG: ASCH domain-containing protein [Patescibacteria group bacterium]